MSQSPMTDIPVGSPEHAGYDPYLPLSRMTGTDEPFAVRFGGARSRSHPMCLRFGPMGHGDVVCGHLLIDTGLRQDVLRDAVIWDHATRAFVVTEPREVDRLAEQLDAVAAVFGGMGRFLSAAALAVKDTLTALLRPSFFVVGGIGTIIGAFLLYYVCIYLIAHWAIWWVILPCVVTGTVCAVIAEVRHDRLRNALLSTANEAFARAQHSERRPG